MMVKDGFRFKVREDCEQCSACCLCRSRRSGAPLETAVATQVQYYEDGRRQAAEYLKGRQSHSEVAVT